MAAIDFPTSPTVGQEFTAGGLTWTWDGVKWTAASSSGGGGIADAPSDGTLYGRKSLGWAHVAHTDITDWTATLAPYALTSSVPAASSSSPLMDGTAAVGTGTTFARADHVHPSDTSRLALTGGTLTGALTPSQTAGIVGTTTNNNANAGSVGEIISSIVTSPLAMTSGTYYNLTTISLTAGDWDISGEVWFTGGTGGFAQVMAAITSVSLTPPASPSLAAAWSLINATLPASVSQALALRTCCVSLAATTTYYLVSRCTYASGSATSVGVINARRAR